MSTAAERQQRANEIDAAYEAKTEDETFLERLEQAIEDGLIDMQSPPVLRVRAFIRLSSLADNPNPLMQKWADTWLKATEGLVVEAQKILSQKAARLAAQADVNAELNGLNPDLTASDPVE